MISQAIQVRLAASPGGRRHIRASRSKRETGEKREPAVVHFKIIPVTDPDLDATLEAVARLGGRTAMPPMAVTNGVTIAHVADPEGHVVGLFLDRA